METLPGEQPQRIPLRVEHLHARHVACHQIDGSIQDAQIKTIDVSLLNEQRADFLQAQRFILFRWFQCYSIKLKVGHEFAVAPAVASAARLDRTGTPTSEIPYASSERSD